MTRRDEFRVTRKSEIGQSLLEVMVALAVSTLVLTSLVSAVVVSVRNARFAKNQSLATKYAQEGIDPHQKPTNDQPYNWKETHCLPKLFIRVRSLGKQRDGG